MWPSILIRLNPSHAGPKNVVNDKRLTPGGLPFICTQSLETGRRPGHSLEVGEAPRLFDAVARYFRPLRIRLWRRMSGKLGKISAPLPPL